MTYHGTVKPGGPAQVRELPALVISKLALGPMDNNTYLLRCRRTGASLLVDAPGPADGLLELVAGEPPAMVVLTHGHPDHSAGLVALVQSTAAAVLGHTGDAELLPVPLGRALAHGDVVTLGDVELSVIHLRGHTPGSIVLAYDDPAGHAHLFTGDSLFPGGPGRTTNPDDFTALMVDLEARVFDQYGDETWVYPGHGNDTTLGAERPHLDEWRARGW